MQAVSAPGVPVGRRKIERSEEINLQAAAEVVHKGWLLDDTALTDKNTTEMLPVGALALRLQEVQRPPTL